MLVFSTSQEKFLLVLQRVSGIVEKRSTLPILSNFLLEKKDNALKLTASDLEIQIKTTFSLEEESVAGDFSTTAAARKMIDILRSLPSEQKVSFSSENNKLLLQSGKSRFSLQTLPAADFPIMREADSFSNQFHISQKTLKNALSKISFSMAVNDIRYYLNGILLLADNGKLSLVATDGHRLAYVQTDLQEKVEGRQEIILPRKTVLELQKLLGDNEDPVRVCFSSNQAKFVFGQVELVSKIVEGKFPEYEKVIPKDQKNVLNVPRSGLLSALHRVSVLTSDKFKGVRFNVEPGTLKISSQNSDQEEALDEIDIDYAGDVIEIGFNINYIVDVISVIDSDDVLISLSDANGSALITVPQDDSFKYVVMPMRI